MKKFPLLVAFVFFAFYSAFSQNIEPLIKKAETAKTWRLQVEGYLAVLDTLFWLERIHDLPPYAEKALNICADQNCGELLLEAQFYHKMYAAPQDMDSFVMTTLKEHKFKNPLFKAKLLGGLYGTTLPLQHARKIYEAHASNSKYLSSVYCNLFYAKLNMTDMDSSLFFIRKSIALAKKNKDHIQVIRSYEGLAIFYRVQKKHDKAIKILTQIVAYAKKHYPNQNIYYRVVNLLDKSFLEGDNYQFVIDNTPKTVEAIKGNEQILEYEKKYLLTHAYNNLSSAYEMANMPKNTLEVIEEVAALNNSSFSIPQGAMQVRAINAYIQLKDYETAKALSTKILRESSFLSKNHLNSAFINVFYDLYRGGGISVAQFPPVLDTLVQQITSNNEQYFDVNIYNAYVLQSLIATQKGNAALAQQAILKSVIIADTLQQRENDKYAKELLVKYENKEQQQQILIQKEQLARKNLLRNVLIVGMLILLVFIAYAIKNNQLLKQNLANKEKIAEQAEALERLYNQQNRLFANIAHELKTPLTLILNPLNTIASKISKDSDLHTRIQVVKRNVRYLQQTVQQVMDLSKSESEPLQPVVTRFNFNTLLTALRLDFESLATYQVIGFQCDTMIEKSVMMQTDGEKLFIILKNLLSNAFKYTPKHGKVRLTALDLGESLQITVQDTGCGIAQQDLPYIFDRFFQTHDKEKLVEGGTGIGLSVCREYTKLLSGSITVNSVVGGGTSFVIILPKKLNEYEPAAVTNFSFPDYAQVAPTIARLRGTQLQDDKPHLLIVEDSIEIAEYLAILLQDTYYLSFESNGQQALERLKTETPDLIITDLMMPIMNGYQLLEAIKAEKTLQQIPIIVLTALNEAAQKLKALRFGIDDYLEKPFNEEELRLKISHLLNNRSERALFAETLTAADLTEIAAETQEYADTEQTEWLTELEQTAREHIADVDFNVNALAKHMNMSYQSLYNKVKLNIGITPNEYLNQMRFQVAREFLENKKFSSVKKIAYAVGFKDEKNFSRNFKQRFGKYPSEYLE